MNTLRIAGTGVGTRTRTRVAVARGKRLTLSLLCTLALGISASNAHDRRSDAATNAAATAEAPLVNTTDSRSAIDRGHYVAILGDCSGCHTKPGGQNLAGGQKIETPFGPLYSPNLTPDAETGLGRWTYAEFEKALRHGQTRDGSPLYPAMPYSAYTKVSDQDLQDLWTYLQSLPPARNEIPEGKVRFPFNIEAGLNVWQSLYFEPGRFKASDDHSSSWNRGAYLVQGLAHCGSCHTPRNALYASEKTHALTGGKIPGQTWYAQDISTDPRSEINEWTVPELVTYLKTGVRGKEVAIGPMRDVVEDSLSKLSDADLEAIATYLKNSGTPADDAAPREFEELPQAALQSGERVYAENCSGCHGSDGQGAAGAAPDLRNTIEAAEPFNAISVVLHGAEGYRDYPRMASFAHTLDNEQIADVVNYIRRAWSPDRHPALATPAIVGALRDANRPPKSAEQPVACLRVSDAALGEDMRKELAGLGTGDFTPQQIKTIVAHYRQANPDSASSQTINALVSGYCTSLQRKDVDPDRMLAAEFAFSAAVTRELIGPANP